ncbi:MAG: glycerol-3-phosphate dehydrogenase/oxidase [Rubripirellula sp.]|nr:glycerol-3-phosphate dehydrogenase/oxidase [Rubripirellula sp.]
MNRAAHEARIGDRSKPWDIVVIGGGATGAAIALDAATRNLDVLLLERADFGNGTSSRSTKLVHGGVRYLRQGNLTLVRDALRERTTLRKNAPHLVHDVPFLIPCQNLWQRIFYGLGLKLYDFLAVRDRFGKSRGVTSAKAFELVPPLRPDRVAGGVVYHDGQFDDARLLINMLQTAAEHNAGLMNYMSVEGLLYDDQSQVSGVIAVDQESHETLHIEASCVINAAGPFCDQVRQLDQPECQPMIAPSQGVHLVLPRTFLPGQTAMIVPKTSDGRVVFIIPWHDRAIVGTTDTPISTTALEPTPTAGEISFLLETAAEYLSPAAKLEDVLSVFTGIRPLVKGDKSSKTASLSRDHVIRDSETGLITIAGGKWTTVRKMAEDCVDHAIQTSNLNTAEPCRTQSLPLHGASEPETSQTRDYYGTDLALIRHLEASDPAMAQPLTPSLSIRESDIIWAIRHEMARTLDDVLSRRTRSLLLDSRAAVAIAPQVSAIMAAELNRDSVWQRKQLEQFNAIAQHYLPPTQLH